MKKICMFLNGPIRNDSRVIRTIISLSNHAKVDLFYIDGSQSDSILFNKNVTLFSIYKPKNIITRHTLFYNEFNFLYKEAELKKTPYDVIYCNDLPTLKAGVLLKKKYHTKLVYDSHEIYIATLNQFYSNDLVWTKKWIMIIIIQLMKTVGNIAEKRMVKNVDFFITTSESFKNYFQKKLKIKNIIKVMNCPKLSNDKSHIDFREKYNFNKNDFIVIFQGMLNKGRALDKLIEAMKYVNKRVKLVIVGDGMLKDELEKKTSDLLLSNVRFTGLVQRENLLSYSRGADIGINLQETINISKKLASANKLYEYSHAGIPIIASDVPENRYIIRKYNNGILIKNNIMSIANSINDMSEFDLSTYQKNSINASLIYNWQNQEQKLLTILK